MKRPVIGVLSHAHEDHAGGALSCARRQLPVLVTEGTYAQLVARYGRFEEKAWRNLYVVHLPFRLEAGDGTVLELLPGSHAPGAALVALKLASGYRLLFTGDYCLNNAYLSTTPAGALAGLARGDYVLIDATLLGHEGSTDADTDISSLERRIRSEISEGRNVVVASSSCDHLYAAYMWFFSEFYGGAKARAHRSLLVSPSALRLLETTFGYFIRRDYQAYDGFMRAVLGLAGTMHNYLESVHLYPLVDGQLPQDVPPPVDVFCNEDELPHIIAGLTADPFVLLVGRPTESSDLLFQSRSKDNRVVRLEGPDFSFHSSARDVTRLVTACSRIGVRPLLFHNFPRRMRRALAREGVSADCYDCVSPRRLEIARPER